MKLGKYWSVLVLRARKSVFRNCVYEYIAIQMKYNRTDYTIVLLKELGISSAFHAPSSTFCAH